MTKSMSWGDRFALIELFNPTEEQIIQTFDVTAAELNYAQQCIEEGIFKVSPSKRVNNYENVFIDDKFSFKNVKRFATKPKREVKKRGRKGDKIQIAFDSIPNTPVPLDAFAKEYGISIPVLRQSKRFDKTELPGSVKVKKLLVEGSTNKQLMIWRETE